jgi:trk system potassium uptake protein TrkH
VTTRTAGFNTQDLSKLTDNGKIVMIVLMLMGGAPGSTAGGMKVTTILVLLASSLATFRDHEQTILLKRTVKNDVINKASSLFMMYIFLFLSSAMIISHLEKIDIMTCMFETASAIGTVGLTLGITSSLSLASRMILTFLMYFGRVGGLTIIFAAVTYNPVHGKHPSEDIAVG